MKTSYAVALATNNLRRSKLRTWLTITGIVIGVAAVVLIVSLGTSLQQSVSNQLGGLGADVVSITPGGSRAGNIGAFRGGGGGFDTGGRSTSGNLTTRDLQNAMLVPNVKLAVGTVSGSGTLVFQSKDINARIRGVDVRHWREFTTDTIATGRDLTPGDTYAVIIGNNLATKRFDRPITINSIVTIEDRAFRVVGILAPSGGSGFGGGGSDDSVVMPLDIARQVAGSFTSDQLSGISVKVADVSLLDDTVAALTARLSVSRHVIGKNLDFTVTAAQSLRNSISSVTSTLSTFLGGIAAISLLVGAIGIANTMFMAVLERTRQIGVLKALGATRSEITRLFIIEAAVLGFTGGAIGLVVSFGVTALLTEFGVALSLPIGPRAGGTSIDIAPGLAAFALLFSALIGMAAGYFPARQAASLKPLEALRYE